MIRVLLVGHRGKYAAVVQNFGNNPKWEFVFAEDKKHGSKIYEEAGEVFDIVVLGLGMAINHSQEFYQEIKRSAADKKMSMPIVLWISSLKHSELSALGFYAANLYNKFIPEDTECLQQQIYDAISITLEEVSAVAAKHYNRVSIERIKEHNYVNCDLFLKLSESKFVKIINADEMFTPEIIDNYRNKGVEYLHVRLEDYMRFSDFIYSSLKSKFKISAGNDHEVVHKDLEMTSFVLETINNLKLDEETVKTLHEIGHSSIQMVKRNPSLKQLLEKAQQQKGYIYSHSLLISYISGTIAMKMQWASFQTLQKLGLAAILHDVVFDNERLAKIDNLGKIDYQNFTISEVNEIKKHPLLAKELIDKMKDLPPDVSSIVSAHHERFDGQGFPRALTGQHISQITALFIVAEDFVNTIFEYKKLDRESIHQISTRLKEKYDMGNFKRPCEGMLQTLNEML
ncbi:MAG: HD domain-containing protein [Oligoflexia bacterium]|nr:HD domain-containing protein [Oligoflexia bacterium]